MAAQTAPHNQTVAPFPVNQPQQYPYPAQPHVIIQSEADNESCCRRYENYKAMQSFRLGLAQVIIGILCIVFNIVGIVLTTKYNYNILASSTFISGYGIWCPAFFIIAGGLGMGARSKNGCPIIAFMVMSILSAVVFLTIVAYAATGIVFLAAGIDRDLYFIVASENDYNSRSFEDAHAGMLAMHSMILICGFIEFVIAIWSSVICCQAACCCGETRQVVRGGLQMDQQNAITHAQGQPQFYAQQPYAGATCPAQYGLATPMPPSYSEDDAKRPPFGGPRHDDQVRLVSAMQ